MANRSQTIPSLDKKYFSSTAVHTRKINVRPKIMRGGTRL